MDLRKLPFVPLHFFFFQFTPGGKRLFIFLMAVLLFAGGFLLFARHQPDFWAISVSEVAESVEEPVKVAEARAHYRSFDINANAIFNWVRYTAGPMMPHPVPAILFIILQIVGWTAILAAATLINSRWHLIFYFLFALFIHFSDVAGAIYPADTFHLLEFAVIISLLLLAWLFQSETLRWNVSIRFLSILSLMGIWFGLAWFQGGWIGFQRMSSGLFLYLLAVSIPFLFFIGKDLTNLIVAATNNRPNTESRLGFRWMLGAFIPLLLIEFLLFHNFMRLDWLPISGTGLLATHLILIAGIATVFTSQNQLHQAKKILQSHRVFSLLLTGWAISVFGFLFMSFSGGDYMLRLGIERLATIFFLFIGAGHLFYIFFNHYPLIREKINVYYLMTQGPRLRMVSVWIIGLIGIVVSEGQDSWLSTKLFSHSYKAVCADVALLDQDSQQAERLFTEAVAILPFSVKANYMLATLSVGDPKTVEKAVRYYQNATAFFHFPLATLNAGNLLQVNNKQARAKALWEDPKFRRNDPYISNNLGLLYYHEEMPDSAISALKRALLMRQDLSSVYSNLARIYRENDKPEVAKDFFAASLDFRKPGPHAVTNALWYGLMDGTDAGIKEEWLKGSDDFFVSYNYMLRLLNEGKKEEAAPLLKAFSDQQLSPEAMLLDAWVRFDQDSLKEALSRFKFVKLSYPQYAAKANYLEGVAFFERNVPEMARSSFRAAGEAGDPTGYFYGALMDIDLGNAQLAQTELSRLRISYPELWQPVSRELAMLLKAYNAGVYAQMEWNFEGISRDEQMRISLYADSMNHYITALENFREMIAADSADTRPYLEMSRIYLKYGNPLAVDNLQYGLAKDPENPEMTAEMGYAWLSLDSLSQAKEWLAKAQKLNAGERSLRRLEADIQIAAGDTASGAALLETLFREDPLEKETALRLAELYRLTGDGDAGYRLVYEALEYNTENPDLWYAYAWFSRKWSQDKDAGFGAARAIELTASEKRKQEIAMEFADELKLISD